MTTRVHVNLLEGTVNIPFLFGENIRYPIIIMKKTLLFHELSLLSPHYKFQSSIYRSFEIPSYPSPRNILRMIPISPSFQVSPAFPDLEKAKTKTARFVSDGPHRLDREPR